MIDVVHISDDKVTFLLIFVSAMYSEDHCPLQYYERCMLVSNPVYISSYAVPLSLGRFNKIIAHK